MTGISGAVLTDALYVAWFCMGVLVTAASLHGIVAHLREGLGTKPPFSFYLAIFLTTAAGAVFVRGFFTVWRYRKSHDLSSEWMLTDPHLLAACFLVAVGLALHIVNMYPGERKVTAAAASLVASLATGYLLSRYVLH